MKKLVMNLLGLALIVLVLAGLAVKASGSDSSASQAVVNTGVEGE
jgi:hypothetical protein